MHIDAQTRSRGKNSIDAKQQKSENHFETEHVPDKRFWPEMFYRQAERQTSLGHIWFPKPCSENHTNGSETTPDDLPGSFNNLPFGIEHLLYHSRKYRVQTRPHPAYVTVCEGCEVKLSWGPSFGEI